MNEFRKIFFNLMPLEPFFITPHFAITDLGVHFFPRMARKIEKGRQNCIHVWIRKICIYKQVSPINNNAIGPYVFFLLPPSSLAKLLGRLARSRCFECGCRSGISCRQFNLFVTFLQRCGDARKNIDRA